MVSIKKIQYTCTCRKYDEWHQWQDKRCPWSRIETVRYNFLSRSQPLSSRRRVLAFQAFAWKAMCPRSLEYVHHFAHAAQNYTIECVHTDSISVVPRINRYMCICIYIYIIHMAIHMCRCTHIHIHTNILLWRASRESAGWIPFENKKSSKSEK